MPVCNGESRAMLGCCRAGPPYEYAVGVWLISEWSAPETVDPDRARINETFRLMHECASTFDFDSVPYPPEPVILPPSYQVPYTDQKVGVFCNDSNVNCEGIGEPPWSSQDPFGADWCNDHMGFWHFRQWGNWPDGIRYYRCAMQWLRVHNVPAGSLYGEDLPTKLGYLGPNYIHPDCGIGPGNAQYYYDENAYYTDERPTEARGPSSVFSLPPPGSFGGEFPVGPDVYQFGGKYSIGRCNYLWTANQVPLPP